MNNIKKILVANRGEIACRIIKTIKKMGLMAVSVYSDADTFALHRKLADESFYLGQSESNRSYCNIDAVCQAIDKSGADAVHPGYGFLSENPEFAQRLEKMNVVFIGPSYKSMLLMANKISAKKIAQQSGVNVIPGYIGKIDNHSHCMEIAKEIGYPLIIKAAAGGGGKGMRIIYSESEMKIGLQSAMDEAKKSFGDGDAFIERYIKNTRHIEIQVLGDKHGNHVCLGERECSIQRRYQKIIEEAPSTFVTQESREQLYKQSIGLVKKIGYFSAGTIEFAADNDTGCFYFLEMNTRLQVEHPVTELVVTINNNPLDLVKEMINIANDEKLTFRQNDVRISGHAFESRIYSEDPEQNFTPITGRLSQYVKPKESKSIRIDDGIETGDIISVFYDPMIAKLCSYGTNRKSAINTMSEALSNFYISGIRTNTSFLESIFSHSAFIDARISTSFINQYYTKGFSSETSEPKLLRVFTAISIYLHLLQEHHNFLMFTSSEEAQTSLIGRWVAVLGSNETYMGLEVRKIKKGYMLAIQEDQAIRIKTYYEIGEPFIEASINDDLYKIKIISNSINKFVLSYKGYSILSIVYRQNASALLDIMPKDKDPTLSKDVISSMTGVLVDIFVKPGDHVTKNTPIFIIEAMKMQNTIFSTRDGIIEIVHFKTGDTLKTGQIILSYTD